MKIYFGHNKNFDYQNELYKPIRESSLNTEAEIIFPHEIDGTTFNSKEGLKNFDLIVAEVSQPSTGLGIEIGYADFYKIPIIVCYKSGSEVSNSAKQVASQIIEYKNTEQLIEKLMQIIKTL